MFEIVMACTGVDRAEIAHIGDEPYYDIEAAHRAEVLAIWMNRMGRQWPREYRKPHLEISSFVDLDFRLQNLLAHSCPRSDIA